MTGKSSTDTEKSSEKSSEKILLLISDNAFISAKEISKKIGVSSRAVEKQMAHLKAQGILRRVGPDKGGHWEIITTDR